MLLHFQSPDNAPDPGHALRRRDEHSEGRLPPKRIKSLNTRPNERHGPRSPCPHTYILKLNSCGIIKDQWCNIYILFNALNTLTIIIYHYCIGLTYNELWRYCQMKTSPLLYIIHLLRTFYYYYRYYWRLNWTQNVVRGTFKDLNCLAKLGLTRHLIQR